MERDYIAHDSWKGYNGKSLKGHYSENWTPEDQSNYMKWYYRTHKEKWAKSDEQKMANNARDARNKSWQTLQSSKKTLDESTSSLKSAITSRSSLKTIFSAFKSTISNGRKYIGDLLSDKQKQKNMKSANRKLNNAIREDMSSDTSMQSYKRWEKDTKTRHAIKRGKKWISNFIYRGPLKKEYIQEANQKATEFLTSGFKNGKKSTRRTFKSAGVNAQKTPSRAKNVIQNDFKKVKDKYSPYKETPQEWMGRTFKDPYKK